MKILIVYPEYPVTFWSFKYALEFVHEKSNLPPLGVLRRPIRAAWTIAYSTACYAVSLHGDALSGSNPCFYTAA